MNEPDEIDVANAMIRHGGSFVKALGEAFFRADLNNKDRIRRAFPDYWATYTNLARRFKEQQHGDS